MPKPKKATIRSILNTPDTIEKIILIILAVVLLAVGVLLLQSKYHSTKLINPVTVQGSGQ